MMLLKSFTTDVPAIFRPFNRLDKTRRRKGPGRWLWIVGLLILSPAVSTASTLNYTHLSGSISSPYNDGNGGILQVNPGPYEYSGNGTNTIRIVDPRDTPPNFELFAVAGLNGFTKLFSGSSATGSLSIAGRYSVAGTPEGGADGVLEGTATYHNYIGAVGVAKLLGSGTTSLTSSIAVAPFTTQTPGPSPNPTTLSAGLGSSSAGSLSPVGAIYSDSKTGITDGNYSVNLDFQVSASRTAGAVTAMAAWISQDLSWTLQDYPTTPVTYQMTPHPTLIDYPTIGQVPYSMVTGVSLTEVATALEPENLLLGSNGNLLYSSVDESSLTNPIDYATNGPTFSVGNAVGLEYLSDLVASPSGKYYALQSFGFDSGNINPAAAGLLTVDPDTGVSTPLTLSTSFNTPSSLAFSKSGFGGAEMLVTELGLDEYAPASLLGVDGLGNVTRLVSDLGVDNPVDLQLSPGGFGNYGSEAFVLDVGEFTDTSVRNGSGSVLVIDELTQEVKTFVSDLNNPLSMAFANGTVLGDPEGTYLYVLEQGDLDPLTGQALGDGLLAAYDALGNRIDVVGSIDSATSLVESTDGSGLYFSSDRSVFLLAVPEPSTGILLLLGILLAVGRRPGGGTATS